jgi:EAL domain-containing protein (putative c-di-GMP-specific phosphodiesterase class I)/GGDEF domain-containing protein
VLKKETITIYQLIYRRFIRQSLVGFTLILVLVIALFLLNNYQSTTNKKALQALSKKSFEEISKQTSEVINQRFKLEKLRLYQLRDTLELILSQRKSFTVDDGKWIDKGGFYIHNDKKFKQNLKTSVYSTNLLDISKEDIVFLSALQALVPSVARSVDDENDLITAAWINIGKKYALAYPAISPIDELSPDLDVTQYSFYYNGDSIHNPNRDIIYTPLYKEPWAVDAGELGAYLIPIYEDDKFIGVIGLTLSAKGVADVIKDLKLPFDAYAQLVDEDGYLIVTSDDDKSYADFKRHSFYKLYQNPDFKDRSLMKIEQNSQLNESYISYTQDIGETDFKLNFIAKNDNIFASVNELTKETFIVGLILAVVMSIIYIITLILGVGAIKSLAHRLSNILIKAVDFSSSLGQRDDIELEHSNIVEFENLNSNLASTHNKLLDLIIKDEQTGLYNRHKLLQDLSNEEGKSLMIFELNNYKTLFNLYGLGAVSILIEGVVERLSRCKDMYSYRLEDDTFAILQNSKEADNFFKLHEELCNLGFSYESIHITPKLFSAIAISHPLIEQAGIALLEARELNSSLPVTCKHTNFIKDKFEHNLDWSNRFNKALKDKRLLPYFQPIYNIKEQRVDKFESLVRMKEDDNIIAPFHFLEVATQMGKIYEITKIMIQKVFAVAARHREICFNINISFKDFIAFDLVLYIQENQHAYGISPSQITFELLETDAIEDIEPVMNALAKLKKDGYKIAIDDFGTGHSNFAHLMMMQVDYIKIDGGFIKNINRDPNSATIAQTITKFSELMNAQSVAEFVADEAIFKRVRNFGIDYAQGYFISEPMPSSEIKSFLEDFSIHQA